MIKDAFKLNPPKRRFVFTSSRNIYTHCWASIAIHLWEWMKPEHLSKIGREKILSDGFMLLRKMTYAPRRFMDCVDLVNDTNVFSIPYAMWRINEVIKKECDETWEPFIDVTYVRSPCPWPKYIGEYNIPWQIREEYRLEFRYKKVPWHNVYPPIEGHFVHVSEKSEGMIAYTPDEIKGKADRQVIMKPGRYLKKYYNDIPPEKIREWATLVDNEGTLKFAKTAEEIIAVYDSGPESCMTKRKNFKSHIHPCTVYGDSDLQLAYLQRANGRITDRVLVWPEKKKFGRSYGSGDGRIERKLELLGYEEWQDQDYFEGARIRRIQSTASRHLLVMPYLDGAQRFDIIPDDTEWVRIGNRNSPLMAKEANGLAVAEDCKCPNCHGTITTPNVSLIFNDALYCSVDCMDDMVFHCMKCDERFARDDKLKNYTVNIGASHLSNWYAEWCQSCIDKYAFHCHGAKRWFARLQVAGVWQPRHVAAVRNDRSWAARKVQLSKAGMRFGFHHVEHDGKTYEKTWFEKHFSQNVTSDSSAGHD